MAPFQKMKPGAGGVVQNAKAQASTKQAYGKGGKVATKYPAKKGGMSGDSPKPRSALAGKKKK